MKKVTSLLLILAAATTASHASLVQSLGDEGWDDLGLLTGNSFGNDSFDFGVGPLGVTSVQLNALGSVGTPTIATLEMLSGINIAEYDGSTYSILSLLGTYTTWAESAFGGSTPNLKFSLFTSNNLYTPLEAISNIGTANMSWSSTLVYLPSSPTPTVGAWVDQDVTSTDWWWTGAAQARQSYESWFPQIFAKGGGQYLYIGTVQLGLGGSTNTSPYVGHVDKMDISFGTTHTLSYDFGLVSVPEPSTYGLIGAGLLLGLVSVRRFKARKQS